MLPHSREATNVTALLFTKVLLMGMNHALGKKKKGHKFADGVDGEAADIRDVEALPFEEAVEYMRARLPLEAAEYYRLTDKARFRAFTVSLLADGDLLVKTKDMLAKNLEEGGGLKDFLVKTDTDLLKGWAWQELVVDGTGRRCTEPTCRLPITWAELLALKLCHRWLWSWWELEM